VATGVWAKAAVPATMPMATCLRVTFMDMDLGYPVRRTSGQHRRRQPLSHCSKLIARVCFRRSPDCSVATYIALRS
jgi:hypothetical protein